VVVAANDMRDTHATARTYARANARQLAPRPPRHARPPRRERPLPRHAPPRGDGTTPMGNYGFVYGFGSQSDPGVDRRSLAPRAPELVLGRHARELQPLDRAQPVPARRCGRPPDVAYRYAAVIDFNYRRPVYKRGSGIFLHVQTGRPTRGCVSLRERDLLAVLRWLRPGHAHRHRHDCLPARAQMSINPALEDVRFCPRCGSEADIDLPALDHLRALRLRRLLQPQARRVRDPPRARRAHLAPQARVRPGGGLWTFPGGFVDLGESVEDAALRETREELEIDVELEGLVGVYSRPEDRVVLVVYAARALGTPRTTEEATEVRAYAPDEIPWAELAFWSTERALRDSLAHRG
jgi:ADP-ribose pyrophosphatase YjhB (NUDIX family)